MLVVSPPGLGVQPLVITRTMLQGKVFGAGYPSLPTVSLEQFFEQQYKEMMEQHRYTTLVSMVPMVVIFM